MEILTLAEARGRHARAIRLALPADHAVDTFIAELRKLVTPAKVTSSTGNPVIHAHQTGCPVVLKVQQGQQVCEVKLSPVYALEPSDQSLSKLQSVFGDGSVSVVYE